MAENPFEDLSGDGVLDGKEIIAALKKEEQAGLERTASERAHGVMEFAGARVFAGQVNRMIIKGVVSNPKDWNYTMETYAIALNSELKALAKMSPERIEASANLFRKMNPGRSDAELSVGLADIKSSADFARTFSTAFPKDVKISPEDAQEILAHFGSLAVPLPASGTPKLQR